MNKNEALTKDFKINFKINDKFQTLTIEVFIDGKFFGITNIPTSNKIRKEDQEKKYFIVESLKKKISSFEERFNFRDTDRHYIMDKKILNLIVEHLK